MCMNAHVHTQMYTYIHVYKCIIYIEQTHMLAQPVPAMAHYIPYEILWLQEM